MKKNYISPEMKVFVVTPAHILAGSEEMETSETYIEEGNLGAKRKNDYWKDDEEPEEDDDWQI